MQISVLGAGAWGTALAIAAARHHAVTLWARDPAQAQALSTDRANTRYLPDRPFPDTLVATADWSAAVDHAQGEGLFVVATPMAALRDTLARRSEEHTSELQSH